MTHHRTYYRIDMKRKKQVGNWFKGEEFSNIHKARSEKRKRASGSQMSYRLIEVVETEIE